MSNCILIPEAIADRVQEEFFEKFDILSRQPGLGHRRTDFTTANVLFFPLYSHLIAFRPETNPLQILAIVHGARQVKKILQLRRI